MDGCQSLATMPRIKVNMPNIGIAFGDVTDDRP